MPYKTPGVYVEEISTFPPSVAEVATAIPAFIGYTQLGASNTVEVAEIATMLEYERRFGAAKAASFTASTEGGALTGLTRGGEAELTPDYFLYEALDLYFKNGGGRCYVVSIGNHSDEINTQAFESGLAELERHDEPTLILAPEAIKLSPADTYAIYQAILAQCAKLQDRFAIFDVPGGDVDSFRTGLGTNALSYGAAYHPYLSTNLTYSYDPKQVEISGVSAPGWGLDLGGIRVEYVGENSEPKVDTNKGSADATAEFSVEAGLLKIENVDGKTSAAIVEAWDTWAAENPTAAAGFSLLESATPDAEIPLISGSSALVRDASSVTSLESLARTNTALYNQIKKALAAERMIMPPSAAIAGIYARVDRDRGVWKAPANVSLSSVIAPTAKITAEEQESLNVDPNSGKSINAIRAFTGKGVLIWGARTLAGNDNEWRYVSVRRLFVMIEEAARKATGFAVFEPNDATTWLKVKGMLESYLFGLWERGALQGSNPEQAYFVNVGLGKTMTAQDVLEGRMTIELGIAAVRPAEFIVLRFSHKLAES
ncbi:phage tail sheath family protein [Pseudenhygromyxa sp. WMMC2535]|uniref:phage tail sheath family protein n=1 Tax=Pseudenhygromyxa sp. WMMC2535 TaxID=2712867 RepID=UPI001554F9D9|nr:phage tail sheath C-terminal domain-containing protein [Pseudenhygromyxa sp. WMMC2535]NVB43280.1 phage tail sheath family protein [Pseudenhygromyxa sp. WMMC2535]